MRDYAKISTSVWRSQKFRALKNDDRARLLYFHFHTCAQVNSVGCFSIPIGYLTTDLAWSEKQIREAIDRLCKVYLIEWNAQEDIVRIVGFLEHDAPTNEKHFKAVTNVAFSLPDCTEKLAVLRDLIAGKWRNEDDRLTAEIERLSIAYSKPIGSLTSLTPSLTQTLIPIPAPCADALVSEGLPEWMTSDAKEAWGEYVKMRKKIKAPLTEKAVELELKTLEKLRDSGHDPTAVLEQSIRKCWKGLYVIKDDLLARASQNGATPHVAIEHARDANEWRVRKRASMKTGVWLPEWGPPIGSPGCLVPPEVVREFSQ